MKQCTNCGSLLDNDAVFCTECGTKLGPQKKTCPSCGAEIDDDSLFCSACGQRVDVIPPPVVEQPHEENNVPNYKEAVNENPVSEDTISEEEATENKYKILVYAIAGIACMLSLVWGGHVLYNRYLENQLEFVTPLKLIRVNVTEAELYSEPNEYASLAKKGDGSTISLPEGRVIPAIEDCGDWYKVVPTHDYQEAYIKKSNCEDNSFSPITNTNSTYLTVNCKTNDYGSSYLVYRTDGKKFVLMHRITPMGKETLYLGHFYEGYFIFNYSTIIDNHYWTQYRKSISTDSGNVSLIDFNIIPEEELTEPFKEVIRNKERIYNFVSEAHFEIYRYTNLDISNISNFYHADHPYLEGKIAGKYDFVMHLDIIGDTVKGRYRVLQNQDHEYVNLSGNITPTREIEIHEYKPDGTPTGYYFRGTLKGKVFSGKYLSTERQLKMKFTSHFE